MAPDGDVGRATAYEIGRLVQAGRPLYFSAAPDDLPLAVPDSHVLGADELASGVRDGMPLVALHELDDPEAAAVESRVGPALGRDRGDDALRVAVRGELHLVDQARRDRLLGRGSHI